MILRQLGTDITGNPAGLATPPSHRSTPSLFASLVCLAATLTHAAPLLTDIPAARPDRQPLTTGPQTFLPSPAAITPSQPSQLLHLQSGTFLPQGQLAANLQRLRTLHPTAALRCFIHLPQPPDTAAREIFRSAGIHLGPSVGRGFHFVTLEHRVQPATLNDLGIPWIGGIYPEDKIPPRVITEGWGTWATQPEGTITLRLRYFEDAQPSALLRDLEQLGTRIEHIRPELQEIALTLPPELAPRLLELPDVRWVEETLPPPVEYNDGARASAQADAVHAAPYGLSGDGVTLGICDGGEVDTAHPDFAGRIVLLDVSSVNAHATHVAGTMAGSGARSELAGGTPFQWRGIAPEARVVSFRFIDPIPFHERLIRDHAGILSQNSWGLRIDPEIGSCNLLGAYTSLSADFDRVVRGLYSRPISAVFAIGNLRSNDVPSICGSGPYGTLGPPATSKNSIAVGAVDSEDHRMAFFSSWGPTLDGRLKPDLVAPGSQTTGDMGITSTSTNLGYQVLQGTSMAAPVVSGAIALLVQDYRNLHGGIDPWPSTVKALLLHTAEDLNDNTPHYQPGPDFASGYGRVQIQAAVDLLRAQGALNSLVEHAQTNHYHLDIPPNLDHLKFTLVWDDPPGLENAGTALVNDLDLIVLDPNGTRHYPWTLDPTQPAAPAVRTRADRLNVVEQVQVDGPVTPGTWTISVAGHDVPHGPSQRYSLAFTPPLTQIPPTLLLHQVIAFEDPNDASNQNGFIDPGEEVWINVTLHNLHLPPVNSLTAQLLSETPGVSILDPLANYPPLDPESTAPASNPHRIRITRSLTCGSPIELAQIVDADGFIFTNRFNLQVGERVITNAANLHWSSTDTPFLIPDYGQSPSHVASHLTVDAPGQIVDLIVRIRIDHPWAGDLQLELEHPDGTRVLLVPSSPNSGANFGLGTCPNDVQWTELSDSAPTTVLSATAPFTGTYRPAEPLALLHGKPTAGPWQLRLSDHGPGDQGQLLCWQLEISYEESGYVCSSFNRPPVASPLAISVFHNHPALIQLAALDPDDDPLVYEIVTPPAQGALSDFDPTTGLGLYLPNPDYIGPDLFTYRVNDGDASSEPSTVELTVLQPLADLAVLWSHPLLISGLDQPVSQSLIVTNLGPNTATNLQLEITLPNLWPPPQTSVTTGTYSPIETGGTWTIDTIPPGSSATLALSSHASTLGSDTGQATVTALETDPQPANNSTAFTAEVRLVTDLTLALSGPASPVLLGQEMHLDATLANLGDHTAHQLHLMASLPNGLALPDPELSPHSWTPAGQAWRWDLDDLSPDDQVAVHWSMTALQPGIWTLHLDALAAEVDPNPENNIATWEIEIVPAADLALLSTPPLTVRLAESSSFALSITNPGPSEAVDVLVEGLLPQGLTLLNGDPTHGTLQHDQQSLVWTLGTLPIHANATLHLQWRADEVGFFTNHFAASSPTPDPAPLNNFLETVLEVIPSADLALTLTGPELVVLGGVQHLHFTATNAGPSTATQVEVLFSAADGFHVLPQDPSPGPWTESNPGQWHWSLPALEPGQAQTSTLQLLAEVLGTWTHHATITTPTTADPDPDNNSASHQVDVRADAEIALTSVIQPQPILLGQYTTNRLELINAGPNTATELQVEQQLDPGWALIHTTASSGTWGHTPPQLFWQPDPLDPQTSAWLELTLQAITVGSRTNTAIATAAELDLVESNNMATATAEVLPAADLSLHLDLEPRIALNSQTTQELVLSNHGPSPASDVLITTDLPAALALVSAQPDVGTVQLVDAHLSWQPGPLEAHQSASLRLTLQGDELGNWTHTFTATATEPDPDPANNTATALTAVRLETDLGIAKLTDAAQSPLGAPVRFQLVVQNLGPHPAQNVVVEDTLPASLELVSATTDHGQWSESTGTFRWLLDSLDPDSTALLELTTLARETGVWTNRVTVGADEIDPTPENDSAEAVIEIIPSADLALELLLDPVLLLGQPTPLQLTLTNSGPSTATQIQVHASTLPSLAWTISEPHSGSWTTLDDDQWLWVVDELHPGDHTVLHLHVTGTAFGPVPLTITTTLSQHDPLPDNNDAELNLEVVPAADLELQATGTARIWFGFETAAHDWTVVNHGPSDASNLIVHGQLEPGLAIINHQTEHGSFTSTDTEWTWTIDHLPSQSQTTLQLVLEGVALGSWTHTASAVASEIDPAPSNNSATLITGVRLETDLALQSSASPESILLGAHGSFDVTLTNHGPHSAQAVLVLVSLPPPLSLLSAHAPNGTWQATPTGLTWLLDQLDAGHYASFQIEFRTEQPGQWHLDAAVSAEEIDPSPNNNFTTTTIEVVPATDLQLLGNGLTLLLPQQVVTSTLVLTNAGLAPALDVVVTGQTDAGLELVQGSPTAGNWTDLGAGQWRWELPSLALNTSAALSLDLRAITVGSWTNLASATALDGDPFPANNYLEWICVVRDDADLTLEVEVDPADILRGQPFHQRFRITNTGPNHATQVELHHPWPQELNLNDALAPDGDWTLSDGLLRWSIPTLQAGATATLQVLATPTLEGLLQSQAHVTSTEPDPDPANNHTTWTLDLLPAADLVVNLTGPIAHLPLSPLEFTVSVNNNGPSDATQVLVQGSSVNHGSAPIGTTEVGSWTLGTDGEWTWEVGPLPAGSQAVLLLTSPGLEIGNWTNTVATTSTTPDPDPENNHASWITRIRLDADLAVQSSTTPDTIPQGQEFSLIITASNLGPNTAHYAVVQSHIPPGIEWIETVTDTGQWSYDNNLLAWTIEELAPDQTPTLLATLRGTLPDHYTSSTTISAEEIDPAPDNNQQPWGVTVRAAADLALSRSGTGQRLLGESWTEQLHATNAGPGTASTVTVSGQLQTGTELLSLQTEPGQTTTLPDGLWLWDLATLEPGTESQLALNLHAAAVGIWTNRAEIDAPEFDPNSDDNVVEWIVEIVPAANLQLHTTADTLLPLDAESVQQITLLNTGPSDATNVTLQGDLPIGLALSLGGSDAGTWSSNADHWIWQIPHLPAGHQAALQLLVHATETGSWTNHIVAIAAEADPDPADNQSSWITIVKPAADLAVSVESPAGLLLVGRPITLDLTLTNTGPHDAPDVILTHQFPGGFLVDAIENATGTISNQPDELRWTLETLARETAASLRVTLIPTLPSPLTNTFEVVAHVVDPNPDNNHLLIPLPIQPLADLQVTQTASALRVMINDSLQFTMQVANRAPYEVPNVRLTHALPPGFELVSAQVSQGSTNRTGSTLTTDTGPMPPDTSATLTVLGVPRQLGILTNLVHASAPESDPTSPNLTSQITVLVLRDPPLEFRHVEGGRLELSWPVVAENFQLQFCTSLAPTILWQPNPTAPERVGDRYVVTLKPVSGGGARFYRLIKTTP
jgi:uncharacterized repeat protein (TIGR01451 family)